MATPPPPPVPPPLPPPLPPPIPAAKGGNNTLVIILCVLGGLVLLAGGCVAACTYFVSKKAHAYAAEAQRNPRLAAISLAASLHPDIQIVSKNENTGQITLRNKKTGEVVKLDLNDYSSENISRKLDQFAQGMRSESQSSAQSNPPAETPAAEASSEPKISPARAAALAVATGKLPDFLPAYRGGTTTQAVTNTYGNATIINYEFLTPDAPETVADFYEKTLTAGGFAVLGRQNSSDDNGATVMLSLQHAQPPVAVVSLNAGIKHGRTAVAIVSTANAAK